MATNANIENVTLTVNQTMPVAMDQITVKTPKIMEKSVQMPLGGQLVQVQTPLVSSDLCQVPGIQEHVNTLAYKVNKSETSTSGDERPKEKNVQLRTLATKTSESGPGILRAMETGNTGILGGEPVDSNAIMIGEGMTGCVVVDLQGNVVVQEQHVDQVSTSPYLMEEHLLVQVAQGAAAPELNRRPKDQRVNEEESFIRAEEERLIDEVQINSQRKGCDARTTNGPRDQDQKNCESRWNFREVLVKSPAGLMPLTHVPEEHFLLRAESDSEENARPRRKSAKKARLRWKNIHEVDDGGKVNGKRVKRGQLQPKDKANCSTEQTLVPIVSEPSMSELPLWAKHLSSVRVLENMWVVGVAATSEQLHLTLESHSRNLLCDYVKSHPSSLEHRHKAKSQASRIMWFHRHILFDGVPFTILSSDDLRCSFGMNYKIKRKKSEANTVPSTKDKAINHKDGDTIEDVQAAENLKGENSTKGKREEKLVAKKANQNQVKKPYKDVTYTSCAARITVKVIVKYPGYAIPLSARKKERNGMMKGLRRDLELGLPLEKEELYHIMMPLANVHNHPLSGRSRGIHPSITSKVRELVTRGITTPKVIKWMLDEHVRKEHMGDMVVPHEEDRAYYPKLKDIGNLVYTYCKKMGISAKRKAVQDQLPPDTGQRKRKKHKRVRVEENEEGGGCGAIDSGIPLKASTLQEAVQTFCTEEERETIGPVRERECVATETIAREGASEASSLAEVIRGQLETLRSLTYSVNEVGPLQEMCQSLQVLINSYVGNGQSLAIPEGMNEAGTATAFIIQDNIVNPLPAPSPTQPIENKDPLALEDGESPKPRTTHLGTAQVRQFRPPVALQCLSTLSALSVPQLSRPHPHQTQHQPPTHIMTSVPTHSAPATAPIPQATYQTLAPAPLQDSATPVHVSLPPYFYYVQEVTVPESTQTWAYTSSM